MTDLVHRYVHSAVDDACRGNLLEAEAARCNLTEVKPKKPGLTRVEVTDSKGLRIVLAEVDNEAASSLQHVTFVVEEPKWV